MTVEEAKRLRPGDAVEYWSDPRRGWRPATFEQFVFHTDRTVLLKLRPYGFTMHGRRRSLVTRFCDAIRLPLDAVTSNVFADFLDEHDQHEAADMLRKAFPLVRADGTNGTADHKAGPRQRRVEGG